MDLRCADHCSDASVCLRCCTVDAWVVLRVRSKHFIHYARFRQCLQNACMRFSECVHAFVRMLLHAWLHMWLEPTPTPVALSVCPMQTFCECVPSSSQLKHRWSDSETARETPAKVRPCHNNGSVSWVITDNRSTFPFATSLTLNSPSLYNLCNRNGWMGECSQTDKVYLHSIRSFLKYTAPPVKIGARLLWGLGIIDNDFHQKLLLTALVMALPRIIAHCDRAVRWHNLCSSTTTNMT